MKTKSWIPGLLALALCAGGCDAGGGDASGDGGSSAGDDGVGPLLMDMGAGANGGAGGCGTSCGGGGGDGGAGGSAGAGGAGGVRPDGGVTFACNNGVDDDGDTLTDLADPGCTGPEDDDEADGSPQAQCGDGLDNDGDHWPDLVDPDCTSESDPSEQGENAPTACHNEIDDDGDGFVDFPADPGCRAAGDDDEVDGDLPTCFNTLDDDADGQTDYPNDPGCQGRGDMNEADPPEAPVCANGLDDDGDGQADFPNDTGCEAAADPDESGACGVGHDPIDLNAWLADNEFFDGTLVGAPEDFGGSCGGASGPEVVLQYRLGQRVRRLAFSTDHAETEKPTVLYVRSACLDPVDLACNRGAEATPGTRVEVDRADAGLYYVIVDTSSAVLGPGAFRLTVETTPALACDNGLDDDADGQSDLLDPGCTGPDDDDELDAGPTACSDGQDNDGDGFIDFPNDPDCAAAGGLLEGPICDAALNLVSVEAPGGAFNVPLGVGESVTDSFCGPGLGIETVLAVQVEEASLITIQVTATDGGDLQVSLRDGCNDPASEVTCDLGDFGGTVTMTQETDGPAILYFFVEANQGGFNFPAGAADATVTVTSLVTECNDVADNDADGLVDLADPGCERGGDDSEADPPVAPLCADGLDNDEDGLVDFPDDDGCFAAGDRSEEVGCALVDFVAEVPAGGGIIPVDFLGAPDVYELSCAGSGPDAFVSFQVEHAGEVTVRTVNADFDTVIAVLAGCEPGDGELQCDDDGAGNLMSEVYFDRLEPGTYFVAVTSFRGEPGTTELEVIIVPDLPPECVDEVDNDGDALVDVEDPGCESALDRTEADPAEPAVCADGEDNDLDGEIDYPSDPDCIAAGGATEDPRCVDRRNVIEVGQAGGVFAVNLANAEDLVTLSCEAGGAEVPFALTLTEPSNVRVTAATRQGDPAETAMALRTGCDEGAQGDEELGCQPLTFNGFPLLVRRVEPGTFYLFVEDASGGLAGNVTVTIQVDSLQRACNDGADNDGDGFADADDPGCSENMDDDEVDPEVAPVCFDGIDNDEDGQTDYPADDGCAYAGGSVEAPRCGPGLDVAEIPAAGGVVNVSFGAGADVISDACTGLTGVDAVAVITLETVANVEILATGDAGATELGVILRTDCPGGGVNLACAGEFDEGFVRATRLAPGTYFIYVERPDLVADLSVDVEVTVTPVGAACGDGNDNDDDGLIDALDPGCEQAVDADETDPVGDAPACGNGEDDDGDGEIDFPLDADCPALGGPTEAKACPEGTSLTPVPAEGGAFVAAFAEASTLGDITCFSGSSFVVYQVQVDELSSIQVDVTDPDFNDVNVAIRGECLSTAELACDSGFGSAATAASPVPAGTYYVLVGTSSNFPAAAVDVTISIESLIRECNDGLDNDEDELLDLSDPGCQAGLDDSELDPEDPPVCADGVDNDDDGDTDYPEDTACTAAGSSSESASCDLVEVVAVLGDEGGVVNTNNSGLQDLYNGAVCGAGGASGENVIGLVLSQAAAVLVEATAGNYDSVIFVRTDCDDPVTEIGCDDDGSDVGALSRLDLGVLAPGIYYIFVDGFFEAAGNAEVTVTVTPL